MYASDAGVDFDNDLFRALQNFGRSADGRARHDPALLRHGGSLDDRPVKGSARVTVRLLQAVVAVCQVLREH